MVYLLIFRVVDLINRRAATWVRAGKDSPPLEGLGVGIGRIQEYVFELILKIKVMEYIYNGDMCTSAILG